MPNENDIKLNEILNFCEIRGVTKKGLDIVKEIVTNPPARRVDSRSMSRNNSFRFASKKMQVTIQAESRTLELASIYMKEFDRSVLAYFDQPAHRPSLLYKSSNRNVRTTTTLDYFVISENFVGFEECKPVEALVKLSKKSPGRYAFDELSKKFVMPALDKYLSDTGLKSRVITEDNICKVHIENLALLFNYLAEPVPDEWKLNWKNARDLISQFGPMSIKEIEEKIPSISRVCIFSALAKQELFFDIYNSELTNPEDVVIFESEEKVEINYIDEYESDFHLIGTSAETRIALDRYRLVEKVINGEKLGVIAATNTVSKRSLQRWISEYKKGGIESLIPKISSRGNRESRLSIRVEDIIAKEIERTFNNCRAPTKMHVYGLVRSECEKAGEVPPSRQAFSKRLDSICSIASTKIREGSKRAYQETAYLGTAENDHPLRSVSRYLERCHMDHTQLDIQLVSSDGVNLGKPWLTLITDEHSGLILAAYLSFSSPGIPALMCTIRLMVFNHEVFPEAMVVDGGKEFESVYFEKLMATYSCTVISRKGKPRSGVAVEREFGSINKLFLDNLSGNNKIAKKVREVSSSHNPSGLAIWTPDEFYQELLSQIDKWNEKLPKKGGMSPISIRDKSIERFGIPESRIVNFDKNFQHNVLPAPKRGETVVLKKSTPVQLNRIKYWHPCLLGIGKRGVVAELRYDPFDLNVLYVNMKGNWLKFTSTKKVHRNSGFIESAISAEVARHSLYVHEKTKSDVRDEIALDVERANQDAITRHNFYQESIKKSVSIIDEPQSVDIDIWNVDIPESRRRS